MEDNKVEKVENKNNRILKNILIFIFIIFILIVIGIAIYIEHKSIIKKHQEELNIKIDEAYTAVNKDLDYSKFKEILSSVQSVNDKSLIYESLNNGLNDLFIDFEKNYSRVKSFEIYDLTKPIEDDNDEKAKEILKKNKPIYDYAWYIGVANEDVNNKDYISAYIAYNSAIRSVVSTDYTDRLNKAKNEKNKIDNEAIKQVKNKIQKVFNK